MDNRGIFRGLIISCPPTLEQVQRQNRRTRLLVIFFVVLVCLLPTIFGIQSLWQGWQDGRWDDSFWHPFLTQVFVPLGPATTSLLGLCIYFWQKAQEKVKGVEALPLREAAAAGDNSLAPLVKQQARFLDSADGVADVSQGHHFKPLAAVKQGKYLDVFVDEQGVEWTGSEWWRPGSRYIAWSEARAFYTFSYLHQVRYQSERQQVYVLDAPANTLAWVVPSFWQASTFGEMAAIERLRNLISTYTGLPLRDLTKAAEEVARLTPEDAASFLPSKRASATPHLSSTPSLAEPRVTRPRRSLFPLIGLAPLLSLALLAVTAWGLQTYEPSMYNALLTHIETHQPLFHDALNAPDGFWNVHLSPPAINVGPSSYGYADGAYQLQGVNTPILTVPGIYGDVAVEVTVRLLGHQSPDDLYDSFGLLLHNDGFERNGVSFDISPDGMWSIDPVPNVFAASSAIRTAPGAINRLAVILRGHQDLLYVNNQFVGIYQDSGPTNGPLGFFAETDTASAAFTDFTVYPL